MTSVVIQGDEAVKKRLAAMGSGAQAKLNLAIMGGALVIQTDAKVRAPKLTGNLARSIHIEQLGGGAGVQIGTDVVYAAAQEYGRPEINLPAQPYLRPAVDANLARVAKTIAETFGKLVGM